MTPAEQETRRLRNRQFAIVGIGYLLMLPTVLWMGLIDGPTFADLFKWTITLYVAGDVAAGLLKR